MSKAKEPVTVTVPQAGNSFQSLGGKPGVRVNLKGPQADLDVAMELLASQYAGRAAVRPIPGSRGEEAHLEVTVGFDSFADARHAAGNGFLAEVQGLTGAELAEQGGHVRGGSAVRKGHGKR